MDIQDNPIILKAHAELVDLEKQVAEKKQFINKLYVYLEQPAPFTDEEIVVSAPTALVNALKTIKPDEYFGQPAATAVKAVLKRFRDAERAPVDLEDIIGTLKEGGYKFTAADDKGIKNSLTVMLSKNSEFVRVGNVGQKYGLREWYPNMVTRKKAATRRIVVTLPKLGAGSEPSSEEIEDVAEEEDDDQAEVA